jgi:hypothetical protein
VYGVRTTRKILPIICKVRFSVLIKKLAKIQGQRKIFSILFNSPINENRHETYMTSAQRHKGPGNHWPRCAKRRGNNIDVRCHEQVPFYLFIYFYSKNGVMAKT